MRSQPGARRGATKEERVAESAVRFTVEDFFQREVWLWLKRPESTETYPDGRPVLRMEGVRVLSHDTAGVLVLQGMRARFYPWIQVDSIESRHSFPLPVQEATS